MEDSEGGVGFTQPLDDLVRWRVFQVDVRLDHAEEDDSTPDLDEDSKEVCENGEDGHVGFQTPAEQCDREARHPDGRFLMLQVWSSVVGVLCRIEAE